MTVSLEATTVAQVLPPVATVVAAILGALITGFGAAALKHKWDAAADDLRWQRERASRIRAQRLDAFAQYLAARPDLSAVRSLADRAGDPAVVVSAARLAAANLLILLSDADQRAVVERDLRTVENWVTSWSVPASRTDRTDVPTAKDILDLARELVVEPEQAAASS
jgi:hypothetical protein